MYTVFYIFIFKNDSRYVFFSYLTTVTDLLNCEPIVYNSLFSVDTQQNDNISKGDIRFRAVVVNIDVSI